MDFNDFKDLKTYKSVILNSLAHNDIESPIYRVELIKILDVLKKLELIKRDVQLAKPNSTFLISFTKKDGKPYIIGITIKDHLMILEKKNEFKRLSSFCKANITYINDDGVETKKINIEKESIKQIVMEKCKELDIDMINIEENMVDRKKMLVKDLLAQ